MTKDLYWKLILPLLLSFLVFMFLAIAIGRLSTGEILINILINLAADSLVIIVTMLYIDQVLKSNEKRRWKLASNRISSRIEQFAIGCLKDILKSCNLRDKLRVTNELPSQSSFDHAFLMNLELDSSLATDGIKIFTNQLQQRSFDETRFEILSARTDEATRIIDMFGHQLEPNILAVILQIQENLQIILNQSIAYGQVLTSSHDSEELRSMKKSSDLILHGQIAKQLNEVLKGLIELDGLLQHIISIRVLASDAS